MKAILICPSDRPAMQPFAETEPLAALSLFGREFICYWIEHLVAKGAKEIQILAADRPDQIRAIVNDGSRWGIKIEVIPEKRELTVAEARTKYQGTENRGWLEAPDDISVAEHFPNAPQNKLFTSPGGLFQSLQSYFPHAPAGPRLGLREIQPGVWAGSRTHISPSAKLIAPCWISDHAWVGQNATVGPWAVVEERALVDAEAVVSNSFVGAETFVGKFTTIKNSIAVGSSLINWTTGSHTRITDSFLLSSLKTTSHFSTVNLAGRACAALAMLATSPLALAWILAVSCREQTIFLKRRALCPRTRNSNLEYFEFANVGEYWRRWPQLWNVVRGDFSWVGNRPLNALEAAELKTEFEKLWFAAPTGLFSLADAAGCADPLSDEARAHAAFYASQAGWKLNFTILAKVARQLLQPRQAAASGVQQTIPEPQKVPLSRPISIGNVER